MPDDFSQAGHPFTAFISSPDRWSVIVAYLAGVAGVLSLTSAKSGALIGVLISVTTIPAAANIGVAAALGDWSEWVGAIEQLLLNLGAILLAGVGTLFLQRRLYMRRRVKHLHHEARQIAGLPVGESRRGSARPGAPAAGRSPTPARAHSAGTSSDGRPDAKRWPSTAHPSLLRSRFISLQVFASRRSEPCGRSAYSHTWITPRKTVVALISAPGFRAEARTRARPAAALRSAGRGPW